MLFDFHNYALMNVVLLTEVSNKKYMLIAKIHRLHQPFNDISLGKIKLS
jgi:hypothetical protein